MVGITYPYPPQLTRAEAEFVYLRDDWDGIYSLDEFAERMKERGIIIIDERSAFDGVETDTEL